MRRKGSGIAGSGVLVASLAIFFPGCGGKQATPEWESCQAGYARLFASGELRPVAPVTAGIRELRPAMTGVAERCTTCHLGVEEPALKDAVVSQPYRFHPDVPHSGKEMGCTTCHRGSPAALTSREAHAGGDSAPAMLPLRYTESSCGRCHPGRVVPEAPHLSEGRLLIAKLGCAGCHEIPGFENERNTGYDLDGLGSKVTRPWLVKWLANPKGHLPSTTMPAYRFPAPEIEALADFLLSSTNERAAALASEIRRSAPAADHAPQAAKGEAAVARLGCVSCHAFAGKGGRVGPDLGNVGSKLRPDWLLAWLKFPREVSAGTQMPQYSFPDQEIAEIAEYLAGGSRDASLAVEPEPARHPSPASVEKGQHLFVSSGCVGCHSRSGISRPSWLAPKLDGIGDKSAHDLGFGAAKIERTLASWLKAKVASPHLFNASLRMPDFQLTETEADDITIALLSLAKDVPQRLVVRPRSLRPPEPSKDVAEVFAKYRCLDCHTLGEKGQPLAMDLSRVGSKLSRDWLAAYLRKPYAIRPLVKERMPTFGITEKEIELLVGFFQSACIDPSIPPSPFGKGEIPREQVELGKRLFHEKYGCRACHIVGSEGGVYGPSLNGAGSRMTAAWISAWIRNPKALDPSTRTPDYGLTPEAANALAAYVASQRAPFAGLRTQAERHLQVSESPIPDEVKGGRRYDAEKGRAVYFRYCAFCHGATGRGDGPSVERLGLAPTDFTRLDTMAKRRRADLVRAVAGGGTVVGRSPLMPPYARTLTPPQIDEVVTYIQTFTPLSARFQYSVALAPCEQMKKEWDALEAFAAGAPAPERAGVDRMKTGIEETTRAPAAARCEAFSRSVEEERAKLARQLEALVMRDDVEALGKVLAARGDGPLVPPPPGKSYGETAEGYRRFNQEVQARGRAAFAGRSVDWETWKSVYRSLRSGSLAPEHRVHLPELERMGLVVVTVELKR